MLDDNPIALFAVIILVLTGLFGIAEALDWVFSMGNYK